MAMSSSQDSDAVMADINMTPMVDVLLVLLIIFMLITPALMTGFKAELPQALNLKNRRDDPENTTLGIDVRGAYYLNKVPVSKSDLPAALRADMLRHPDDHIMFVKADKGVTWQIIDEALKIAREADVAMAALISDPAPGATPEEGDN